MPVFAKIKVLKKFTTSLLLVTAFIIISGCVTQKKKDDVGPIGKGYHNMTAHYNAARSSVAVPALLILAGVPLGTLAGVQFPGSFQLPAATFQSSAFS